MQHEYSKSNTLPLLSSTGARNGYSSANPGKYPSRCRASRLQLYESEDEEGDAEESERALFLPAIDPYADCVIAQSYYRKYKILRKVMAIIEQHSATLPCFDDFPELRACALAWK